MLGTSSIGVRVGEAAPLQGPLWAEVKVEESTWYLLDGLLHIQLLKRCRRGAYGAGQTAADTFWMAVRALPTSCLIISLKEGIGVRGSSYLAGCTGAEERAGMRAAAAGVSAIGLLQSAPSCRGAKVGAPLQESCLHIPDNAGLHGKRIGHQESYAGLNVKQDPRRTGLPAVCASSYLLLSYA